MTIFRENYFNALKGKILLITFLLFIACNPNNGNDKTTTDRNNNRNKNSFIDSEKPEYNVVFEYGRLSVKGNQIVDQSGNPVILRGMSLFWSQWGGHYFTPEVVKWLKNDWRCTIIRAPLAIDYNGYLAHPEEEMVKITKIIDAAIIHGLYVVIDWHDHQAEKHIKESKAFFEEMAKKYGYFPNIIYEIYNEPLLPSWKHEIKPYHEEIIRTIRKYDPDNLIICGTRNWSMMVDEAAEDPIQGVNIAYTLHFYAGSHKQWLRNRANHALKKGIALMVTEYGTADSPALKIVDEIETREWWKWLEDNKISYINWSVFDKVEASSVLKPGASTNGGWPSSVLTKSGKLVRDHIRSKNSPHSLFDNRKNISK